MKRVLDSGFAWVQNATFFKKLRFGLNQTQNIASFFIYTLFGLQKAQTNAHLQWVLSFQISHKMYQLSRSPPKSVDIQPNIHTFPHNLHSLKKKKRCTHFPTKCTNFIIIIKNLKKNYRANHIMYHLFQKMYTLSHVMH